ncbi:hypothetical protein LTR62_004420 [Meristemomyces frigidus]|uniref:P-loop containing nucleoside triphosphate hydrolase protein n=1 Tax=Meristemomyces frigidus TaxID=1508187 RepID=A0AAN7TE15_9PEZI|nr:hypothetical protein LTR62_004420 [Meristemomyces frigidus]
MSLRPYQEEAIQKVLDHLAKNEKRLAISLATGGGKTVIFTDLIDKVPSPMPEATKTLILAHRHELILQAAEQCRKQYPERNIEIEMGHDHASGYADITVASVQSLRSGDRLQKFDVARYKLIIVDECHHIAAESYLKVLDHFGLLNGRRRIRERSHVALVGVSATLSRNDGLSLGVAIDHIVYHKDFVEMMDEGWLSGAVFTTVQSGVNLSKVKKGVGDFQTASLAKAVNTPEANAITLGAWQTRCGDRKSTLVFCVDLAHVASLTALFRQNGIDARSVTSNTKLQERSETVRSFRSGDFPVLLNCGIFTEGTDIPGIDCIVLARPTQSKNLLIQMLGRGLRLFNGKKDCHVIDMVSNLKAGLVTTPTLFGLDPDEMVDKLDAPAMLAQKSKKEQAKTEGEQYEVVYRSRDDITFIDYDSVKDLIEDDRGDRHIRAISLFGWVQVGEGRYILSAAQGDMKIQRKDDYYEVFFTGRLSPDAQSRSPLMRPTRIATASTLEQAVKSADTAVKRKKFVIAIISKNAAWRSRPASESQIKFLNSHGGNGKESEVRSITKGQAADWITRIRHGAKGRFDKLAKGKRSDVLVAEKLRAEREKGAAVVGPVRQRAQSNG